MLLYDRAHGCAGLDTAYSNLERYYDMLCFVRCPEGMDPMDSSTASRSIAGGVWPDHMFTPMQLLDCIFRLLLFLPDKTACLGNTQISEG